MTTDYASSKYSYFTVLNEVYISQNPPVFWFYDLTIQLLVPSGTKSFMFVQKWIIHFLNFIFSSDWRERRAWIGFCIIQSKLVFHHAGWTLYFSSKSSLCLQVHHYGFLMACLLCFAFCGITWFGNNYGLVQKLPSPNVIFYLFCLFVNL